MSLTFFIAALAVGGLVMGALFATLAPDLISGGVWPAVFLCVVFAVVAGFVMTDLFAADYVVALPLVLALSPLYLLVLSRSSDGGGLSTGSWGGDSGSGDCGGGDGGGGGCD